MACSSHTLTISNRTKCWALEFGVYMQPATTNAIFGSHNSSNYGRDAFSYRRQFFEFRHDYKTPKLVMCDADRREHRNPASSEREREREKISNNKSNFAFARSCLECLRPDEFQMPFVRTIFAEMKGKKLPEKK